VKSVRIVAGEYPPQVLGTEAMHFVVVGDEEDIVERHEVIADDSGEVDEERESKDSQ
jgi:hypothetical protein